MKYVIKDSIQSLLYFKPIFEISNNIKITDELDIEPFKSFSLEFSSIYWYFKYCLLKDKEINIDKNEIHKDYKEFFIEKNLNFIFLNLCEESNYKIYCIDGNFHIEIYNESLNLVIKNNYKWIKL